MYDNPFFFDGEDGLSTRIDMVEVEDIGPAYQFLLGYVGHEHYDVVHFLVTKKEMDTLVSAWKKYCEERLNAK